MENHHFSWVNQLFLWPFSIAMFVYQRVLKQPKHSILTMDRGWQAWTKSWMRTSWPRGEKQPGKVMGKLLRKTSGNIILLVGSEDSFLVKT